MRFLKLLFLSSILLRVFTSSAQTATITGVILDSNNLPLSNVTINTATKGTSSNQDGYYILQIIADQETSITFSHIGHKNIILEKLTLTTNETYEFNPIMKVDVIQIDGVVVTPNGQRSVQGITNISPALIRRIPGANAGVENILKLLPGVASNNELSTQYSVRGGNFDENLVYINDIEIYKSFLVRSGQQEGLSAVNSTLTQNVSFSAGGFQAKYGDKLSSVLDITYKTPVAFSLQVDASFQGAGIAVETFSKNKKLSSITGVRFRDNNLLLNSLDTQATLRPLFLDVQEYFTYRFSNTFHLSFLGNISLNNYRNRPLTRRTNFGTLDNPRSLLVFFEGQENNRFFNALGALKGDYFLNDNTKLQFIASAYRTNEEERSDIIAQYELGEINTGIINDDTRQVSTSRGIGSQFNRARNTLDGFIFNLEQKGKYNKGNSLVEWGIKYTHEDIRDQIRESEFIDSAGFSIRPPNPAFINNQPEEIFDAPLVPFEGISATNFVRTNRFSGFGQYSKQALWKNHDIYYNIGVRAHQWTINAQGLPKNSQVVVSPRAQLSIKPAWEKDILFRLSGGIYHQPPFYRELRDPEGIVRPAVEAQKSVHIVLGNEYSFNLWNRPFKLTSETFYKKLTNVNPYTIEDVRIRYAANNNAIAFAYGAEARLNGAFVPGTESWISLSYLKTEENVDNRGFISRPTDQRLKAAILFQDYVPTIPNLRLYINLVYSTGVPGGSPANADPLLFQRRLRDFRRADLGISYIFVDTNKTYSKNHWLYSFKDFNLGFEVFNIFNVRNSITNTFVRDADTQQQFSVPNFLTGRRLNLRLHVRF